MRADDSSLNDRVVNAMTIDVEDYFHVSVFEGVVPRSEWAQMPSRVVANTTRLLDLFDEYSVRGTFFVLGWVGERYPQLIRSIAARGHEVASHGYAHQLIYDQAPSAFREDVRKAKGILEDCVGRPVVGYRAPSFSITKRSLWALDVLLDEGHRYDASIFPVRHDRYGIPDADRHPGVLELRGGSLIEVPASTVRIGGTNLPIAGGGYFRLLPYGWTRWGISRVNTREKRPVIFYLHPWEIDPQQPRLHAGPLGRFRHYRNLQHTAFRMTQLLTDFCFDTVESLVERTRLEGVDDEAVAIALPSSR